MMKGKISVFFLLVALVFVWGCEIKPPTPTDGGKFTLEYDHEESWTCFPWGLDRAQNAFYETNTVLDIIYDDTTLTDALVGYLQRFTYHDTHRQWDENNDGVYPGYLCGIKGFADTLGQLIDTIAGLTWMDVPYHCFSFVCGYVAYSWNYRDKTAIHELGHQRAHLSHLCIDDYTMNPDHNAEDCVMGNGEVAICTNQNLTMHPEFCGNCCNAIKGVSW
jgi:hypothetical protein